MNIQIDKMLESKHISVMSCEEKSLFMLSPKLTFNSYLKVCGSEYFLKKKKTLKKACTQLVISLQKKSFKVFFWDILLLILNTKTYRN